MAAKHDSPDRLQNQLNYLKTQTWTITNYVVLLLAGIYGIGRTTDKLIPCERVVLILTAFLIFVATIGLLIKIQLDMQATRLRLDKDDPDPFQRGLGFLGALMVVVTLTTCLAIWSLLRDIIIPNAIIKLTAFLSSDLPIL
jgi:hypothetical protein